MVYPFTSKLLVIDMQKKRQKLTSGGGAKMFAKIKDTNYLYQRLINIHIAYYAKENRQTTYTGNLHQGWLSEPTRKSRVELEIQAANKKVTK